MNPFDLLVDDDNEDPSQLIATQQKLPAAPKKAAGQPGAQGKQQHATQAKPTAKLPAKPLPPTQAGEFSVFAILCSDLSRGFCIILFFCTCLPLTGSQKITCMSYSHSLSLFLVFP